MKTTNPQRMAHIALLLLMMTLAAAVVYAQASTQPSAPSTLNIQSSTTALYPNATALNGTRGYIYTVELNESAPTQKWVGYVGNVNGEYALQDASGNALYDWSIATITGELYATKEGAFITAGTTEVTNPYAGCIPIWSNLSCAGWELVRKESAYFNHSFTNVSTAGSANTAQEDALVRTFTNGSGFANPGFYAGERQVTDSIIGLGQTGTCFGINLNQNNADQTARWYEIMATDGTEQLENAAGNSNAYDIVYVSLLENDTVGYNGATYDFQTLLPQSGLSGAQSNIAFYFYVELI